MKLQVTQENLSRALNNVARVASSRATLPILANILIKTTGNRLSVSATNLDIAITHFVGSKITEEGSITIPARLTQDLISSLPNKVIDVQLDDNKLTIQTEKFKSTINGISAEEFPVMPDIENGVSWQIPAKDLKKALQQTVSAASNDEARPVLTGIYFHSHEKSLYAVATDSYRLAEKQVSSIKKDIDLLIPASAMQDLLRLVGDTEGDVTVTHDEQKVLFKTGDSELVTRLIDGKYPDYRKLIPNKFSINAIVNKSELINITKVSSLFARESAGSITIEINSKSNSLSIRSIASQLGENSAETDAKAEGSGTITLNSRYLLDALNNIDGEDVFIGFNGKLEPSVVKGLDDDSYQHIIMPLKS